MTEYKFDKEILEIRKEDLFMLLAATRRWLYTQGFSPKNVAKISAKIFAINNYPPRLCEEFCEFAAWGDKYAEDESKIN